MGSGGEGKSPALVMARTLAPRVLAMSSKVERSGDWPDWLIATTAPPMSGRAP